MSKVTKALSLFFISFLMCSCDVNSGDGNPPTPPSGGPVLHHLVLSGDYQTEFTEGDTFTYEGLVVDAYYDDNSHITLNDTDYQVSTPDMNVLGNQDVTVTYLTAAQTYTIYISERVEPEDYEGYIVLQKYSIDILYNSNSTTYLNPRAVDFEPDPELNMPYSFSSSDETIATVSKNGGVKSAKNKLGKCIITVTAIGTTIKTTCTVNVVESLPEKEYAWKQVNDFDSLKEKDILVMAAPNYGVTASLDTLHSKLNVVESTFSNDKKTITSLGEGTIEFYLAKEVKNDEEYFTLEAQNGEYLVCTNQEKVKLDSSTNMNRYWDIHSNIDEEEGTGSLQDGAVIENSLTSFGYFMYNVPLHYFTTYVDNSLRPGVMELPFLYRLEEV